MKFLKKTHRLFVPFVLAGVLMLAFLVVVGHRWGNTAHAAPGDAEVLGAPVGINGAPCSYATIGAAISAASSGDTIYIPSGNTYNEVLGLINKDLTFTAALTDCSAADPGAEIDSVVIDGGGNHGGTTGGGLVTIGMSRTVTFAHVALMNASSLNGGIAYVDPGATLILESCLVFNGTATTAGGGVRVYRDAALILREGTLIHGNAVTGTTASGGGGVAVYHGVMTMTTNSNVGIGGGDNTSADGGGGIWLQSSRLYIDDSFVMNNHAVNEGGGVLATGTSLVELHGFAGIGFTVSPTIFSNTAMYGGGVYAAGQSGVVLYDDGKIVYNAADADGGGVYAELGAYVTLQDNGGILSNTADSDGAGVYLTGEGTSLNMIFGGGRIEDNQAGSFGGRGGGGVYVTGGADMYADAGLIAGNTAVVGGGIYVAQDGVVTPTEVILNNGTQVQKNKAVQAGGLQIHEDGPQVVIDGSFVAGNEATAGNGGGIFIDDNGYLTLTNNSVVSDNVAQFNGGGLYLISGTVHVNDAAFLSNSTTLRDGGGIYQASGTFNATDPDIRFNSAAGDGGGIYHAAGSLFMEAVNEQSFLGVNDATRGGGLYDESGETVNFEALGNTRFSFNTNFASDLGGGAFLTNTTILELSGDFVISTNEATNDGGAVYVDDNSQFSLSKSTSSATPQLGGANQARNGGAIYATNGAFVALYNAVLGGSGTSNSATMDGGGVFADDSTILLRDTQIVNNHAGDDGGGVFVQNGSNLTIDTSYFYPDPLCNSASLPMGQYCSEVRENSANGWGAGVYVFQSLGTMRDTAFIDNVGLSSGTSPGAALEVDNATVDVTNSLFRGNGMNDNAAVHVYTDGRYDSRQSTYAGNQDSPIFAVNSSVLTLTNNIMWDNASPALYQSAVTITASCNDTQNLLSGPGNISLDPQFITTTRGAYRLAAGSPAVDACTGTVDHDLDNTRRPINADGVSSSMEFDMGAFERLAHIFLPVILRNTP